MEKKTAELIKKYEQFVSNLEFNSKQTEGLRQKECELRAKDFKGVLKDLVDLAASQPSSPLPDAVEFDKYCGQARKEFVSVFIQEDTTRVLKTEVDSLLICFDQMRDRLSTSSPLEQDGDPFDSLEYKKSIDDARPFYHNPTPPNH